MYSQKVSNLRHEMTWRKKKKKKKKNQKKIQHRRIKAKLFFFFFHTYFWLLVVAKGKHKQKGKRTVAGSSYRKLLFSLFDFLIAAFYYFVATC